MTKRITIALLLALPLITFGQINDMEFGKNRVQFHRSFDDWDEYESENFVAYWYGEGRFVGQSTVQMAEMDFEEIQKTLEYRLNDKMEIIVFPDLTDLHQSNIGTSETFETKTNTVKVVGEKIFVYFDGDHTHLRQQIREGIATVFINAMLFGSNLQEVVQNAISLNLPEWFKLGLVSYIGNEWTTEDDDRLRDVFQTKRYKNFHRFALAEPRLAGHAFWFYIAQQFGKANVSNLLYLTRINRSLDDAVMYLFGNAFDPTAIACMDFYRKRYEREALDMKTTASKPLKIKNKRKLPIPQMKLSPDGKQLAYVQNEIGKWKVYIQDVSTGKRTLLLRGGTRNPFQAPDYNYPLLAWNPDNQRIAVVYERRDVVYMYEKNLKDKKAGKPKTTKFNPDAQRVYSIDYLNAKDMIISANVRGFSDIYILNTYTTIMKQLSNDHWDDLDAVAVNLRGKKGILFSSNRPNERWDSEKLDSINPTSKFDLFYKDLEDTSKNLVRISNTIDADERQPAAVDTTYFSFLNDESGIYNRQMGFLRDVLVRVDTAFYITNEYKERAELIVNQDSTRKFLATQKIDSIQIRPIYKTIAIVRNNSNSNRNILQQSTAPRVGKVAEMIYTEGVPKISVKTLQPDSVKDVSFTNFWMWKKRRAAMSSVRKKPTDNVMKPVDNQTITQQNQQQNTPNINPTIAETKPDSTPKKKKVDIDNYVFQSEFDNDEKPKTTEITTAAPKPVTESAPTEQPRPIPSVAEAIANINVKNVHKFRPARITPYRLKFRSDEYTTRMDNGLLFGGLNSYAGTQQETFSTPPVGILMKGVFKDLLEDYQLEAGIRFPITFNGYEAFAVFDNRKRRLDKRFALYNRSIKTTDNTSAILDTRRTRSQTTLGQYELRYPFDQFQRIQVSATLRSDRYSALATDSVTLKTPIIKEQRIGARVEWVFDNAIDIDMNIKNGTRAKVWFDWVKRFELDFIDNPTFKFNDGFMGVIGFDARHYERILKHAVLAVRAAGATSFGEQKTLFILGGVDNQLLANFNNEVSIPADNYAFQTLAANMRGFERNIRNGTSNVLINTELRVPIFKYLSQKPLTSNFLRNFQLVAFFDAATAWHGNNPFNRNNPLNTVVLPRDNNPLTPVVLTVNYFKDPIVASYGAGLRMLLFGYMLRADYGWGVETRQVQKPMLHIALGTDF